jgi:hypothetical protein
MPTDHLNNGAGDSLRRRLLLPCLYCLARLRNRLGQGTTMWIVGAPSSGGKTTFIRSAACQRVTGLPQGTEVVRPGRLRDKLPLLLTRDTILHYNLLRPVLWAQNQPKPPSNPLDFGACDSVWRLLIRLPVKKRAVIVVADDATLLDRVEARTTREKWSDSPYQRAKFLDFYAKCPPSALYAAWRAELTDRGIPFVEIDSESHAVLSASETAED